MGYLYKVMNMDKEHHKVNIFLTVVLFLWDHSTIQALWRQLKGKEVKTFYKSLRTIELSFRTLTIHDMYLLTAYYSKLT